MMHAVWTIFFLAIGACIGSFLNVVIWRLPRGESLAFPPSHCPRCGQAIRWYHNVPILSWFLLRGKCADCGEPISPRYVVIEAAGALAVGGLYVCYYVLDVRPVAGTFEESWPHFLAHATLLCGLLAASAIDIDQWIIPRSICLLVAGVGLAVSTIWPHPLMPTVDRELGAAGIGAAIGLGVAMLLQHLGFLQPSFLDADDKPPLDPAAGEPRQTERDGKNKSAKVDKTAPAQRGKGSDKVRGDKTGDGKTKPPAVAYTQADGVDPRAEILREVLYLLPAVVGAALAWTLATQIDPTRQGWRWLTSEARWPAGAAHVNGLLASLVGLLIGGLWVWGTRILGTLGFGKEAMGLGDADLMAAVGATTGWIVPSLAFFIAPLFGLIWAIYLVLGKNQRELPYGPWLAAGTLAAMLAYDSLLDLLVPYGQAF
jgi:leader peptidase (prepilin peptidase)/N-methyltransferase